MVRQDQPRRFSKSAAARVGVALLALTSLSACKKEQKQPPKTVYVPIGPKCKVVTLARGAVASAVYSSGQGDVRKMSVYDDGRIVSSGLLNGEHDVPAALDPERVARFEADLVATGVFALQPGCWMPDPPEDQGADGGSHASTWRHAGGAWGSLVRAGGVPPALVEALRLDRELWYEVMKITTKLQDEYRRTLPP